MKEFEVTIRIKLSKNSTPAEIGEAVKATLENNPHLESSIESVNARESTPEHPVQPLIEEDDGTIRFKANPIVQFMLNAGPFNLNQLGMMPWSAEDRAQLVQLLGYSDVGFGQIPTAIMSNEIYERTMARTWIYRKS
jgi:hypothetical protein